jgi:dephospho-CoA kinase
MIIKVGITGGIGSGKSIVSRVFEVLGVPVYYADDAAKRLMNEYEPMKQALIAAFGPETYTSEQLNRSYLSSVVFNDAAKLSLLNSIVHPATLRDAEEWMLRQNHPYALKEAALIFESGAQENLDLVIGVYAPAHLRIQRVMKRDGITRDEVKARMDKQIDEDIKMRLCDYVITNDEQELVIPQVIRIHEKILQRKH